MIPVFKPYMPVNLDQFDGILHSGALSYGKWGKEFEGMLARYIGNDRVMTVNSYNIALLVILSVLELKPGDEVIASPVSCLASNQPLLTKGLKIVWADVDPATGSLDPEDVERKINDNTKAIFHNHYCGYPGYINEINAIGKKNGIIVIDDCIEAFGSEYKGNVMGNCDTDITVFSFQPVRIPNTIDGGAIVFKDEELFNKAKIVRDYGIDRSRFRDQYNEISADCDISVEGYGALMSEVNSYIGCQQMKEVDALLGKQRIIANEWTTFLSVHYPGLALLGKRNDIKPNFWVYSVLTDDKIGMLKYFREKGFYATGVHINNNIYSAFGLYVPLKGVSSFVDRHLALPCGWWMAKEDIQKVL